MQVEFVSINDLDEHLVVWSENAAKRREYLLDVLDICEKEARIANMLNSPHEGSDFERGETALRATESVMAFRAIEKELLEHDYKVMMIGLLMDIRRHTSNLS